MVSGNALKKKPKKPKNINLCIFLHLRQIDNIPKRIVVILNRKMDSEFEWYCDRL